jgi:hypothetical protein
MAMTTRESDREVKFVVFWERIANSGIIEVYAENQVKAMQKTGFWDMADKIKLTCYQVQGDAMVTGKAN